MVEYARDFCHVALSLFTSSEEVFFLEIRIKAITLHHGFDACGE